MTIRSRVSIEKGVIREPRPMADPAKQPNPLVAIRKAARENDQRSAVMDWLRWHVSPQQLRRMVAAAKALRAEENDR